MALRATEISELHHFYVKPTISPTRRKTQRALQAMGKPVKFEGITEELQKILDADMDQVGPRRRAREAFKHMQLSIDHILFKMPCDRLKMTESYDVNSRGLEIFSKSWVPDSRSPKAVVCYCHGYGDTCTFFFEGIARKLASSGYAVFAMDYPGFGLSEGLHGYIPKFDLIVDDVIEQYSKVKENPEFRLLPSFLFGQSMGGAVALKVHLKQPDAWNGAVLAAPMCKLADEMVPPWPLDQILIGLANLFPKQKLVPQKDLAELAFKDVKKRQQTAYNVVAYKHKPRLRTAVELLRTTQEIEQQLDKVSLPLLILHGKDDKVTDPSVSNALYERAKSQDKTLNLYDHSFHSLLEGEADDIILKVFNDIIDWLDKHC
ncbi:caffeoylshikimate esterase-like isoform X1 [Salvia hispanica]|uniref:caffeoylshikimate esterase-like isoform X1 n=1 Tax=Salvia hispanica TaxID=49212 RepID=UPI0020095B47|nr:caffeoylshikimate esterase-like isoform X1 [Salvia hispanica]